nr:plasma membrane calcium-transporting atpase 2 [Colletotrichum truncatum]KAF6793912.1 plasma membrane calcium-transporting atpase 2 [Colletotrichum truncatum]
MRGTTTPYESALTSDKGSEGDFKAENNAFVFTPEQLNKLFNPKSLSIYCALEVLAGIGQGFRSDGKSGLSLDEVHPDGYVSFSDVAVGLYQTVGLPHAPNDYSNERQFIKLNRKKRTAITRLYNQEKTVEIFIHNILVGDVIHPEPGGESEIIKTRNVHDILKAIQNGEDPKKLGPFIGVLRGSASA